MVMDSRQLDLVFGALSDATRRGILAQLLEGHANVAQLSRPYDMSQPAITKHLKVLEAAGLVQRWKIGRETHVRARSDTAEQAAAWITQYTMFWKQHFDAVDEILAEKRSRKDDP
ncbi:metalloregulator ArsR/SmtB family transcription factor [uncultured Roseobacter sp.]|uniref:ArsR/SmtB family transcription factor n=2 Tax=uncultured Roseobacter sp. TaxID=114847 RepID=UPI002636B9AE|nr:metalloregulator ArsR/SmtB family transcription factor [uncultured Roseobacter sp.]